MFRGSAERMGSATSANLRYFKNGLGSRWMAFSDVSTPAPAGRILIQTWCATMQFVNAPVMKHPLAK